MAVKKGYDVLRLIEHNQICYVSSEYVKGSSLPHWIKYHPCVEKEKLFQMIYDIVQQLSQIHKCRGNPCYRYVNPYSIIVTEEGKPEFLDINAESNLSQVRLMQRRTVREHFLPPDEPYYQKASVELDIYGLGRTLQYFLSGTETEPSLSRSEEKKFQKIISKCLKRHSKKTFQNVSEIQKMIPKYKPLKKEPIKNVKKLGAAVAVIAGIIIFSGIGKVTAENIIQTDKEASVSKTIGNDKQDKQEKIVYKTNGSQEEALSMELGTVYFLELKNYGKSREYFESVKENKLAGYMAEIAEYIGSDNMQTDKLRQALIGAETEVEAQKEANGEETGKYYQCILKGYTYLENKEDLESVLRLGKICIGNCKGTETAEIFGYMAAAYENLGQNKEAVDMYEEQMKYEEDKTAREEIYKKEAMLLIQLEQRERAQEILRKGIEEIKESMELRISYIGILLKDSNIDRQICIQNIQEQLKALPKLAEQKEFQKLMKEQGIQVKGEKVWLEK